MSQSRNVPDHVKETIDSIAELRARVHAEATPHQRAIESTTKRLGQPGFVYGILVFVISWVLVNAVLRASGHAPFDPLPFFGLQGIATLCALLMTVLILTTETRLGDVADRRSRLALQFAVLTEQKVAKIIELLESQRRDDPHLRDRYDAEAQAMTKAADPHAIVDALADAEHSATGEG
ncbi:MAG: DUF1003 domain-containing protein [Candidatus Eremiobacteraeota bacterium]|nr:DUF1003 domain-containing protein [Candidatus Eremiobacteraeota bacterium]MBC5826899.1 DUF1003 domain-containing protein [Candidatus Eremiobacteraeota bacterium]